MWVAADADATSSSRPIGEAAGAGRPLFFPGAKRMNMPLEAAYSAGRQSTLQHVVAMEVPRLVRDYGDVRLSIYRAKACGRAAWESPALRALVAEARESYRTLYGQQVPIFDH